MAVFGPLQLTTNGQSLYTKAQTGTTLTFTRMQIGGGQLASGQDPTTLTALISPISYFNINSELANGSTAIIRGIFENTNLTSSTYVCEIGLFAQDPTAGEILYAYANAGTQGDTLPPISDGPISRQFNLNVTVGNASNVTVNIPANTYIPNNQMGVANGVATLDGAGKVPTSQIYSITGQTNNFTATQQFTAPSSSIEANQIILGQANNISAPASPIYLASAAANGVGLDQYGNILPIAPASVQTGNSWSVLDKTGNKILAGYLDGSKKVTTVNNILDDGKSNMGLGITPTYGLHLLGGNARIQALATPSAPTVTATGSVGSTSYTYYIVATDRNGNKTLASSGTTITNGNAALSSSNYNTISWQAVSGAVSYDVLKGSTGTALAIGVTGTSINDTGQLTSSYATPTRNTTADVTIDGALRANDYVPLSWFSPTLQNGWIYYGAGATPGYTRDAAGNVWVKGILKGGTTTNNTVLFYLPVGYRPSEIRYFIGYDGNNSPQRLSVDGTGNVSISTGNNNLSNGYLTLDLISFPAQL